MIGAAGSDPGLQVLAQFCPGRFVKILNFDFQKVPPIANRALDGHMGTMFHKSVHS